MTPDAWFTLVVVVERRKLSIRRDDGYVVSFEATSCRYGIGVNYGVEVFSVKPHRDIKTPLAGRGH